MDAVGQSVQVPSVFRLVVIQFAVVGSKLEFDDRLLACLQSDILGDRDEIGRQRVGVGRGFVVQEAHWEGLLL